MIILDSTKSIEVLLDGSVSANQLEWTASYVDVTTSAYTPGNSVGTTANNPTQTTMVSAPSAPTQRQVKLLSIYNKDTATQTVTIIKDVSGTNRILVKVSLAAGDTLQYADGEGFTVIRSDGGIKTSISSNNVISAGTASASSGTVSFAQSSNYVSIGMSGSSRITASQIQLSQSWWEPSWGEFNGWTARVDSTSANILNLSLQRFFVPYNMTVTRLDMLAHLSVAGSQSGTWSASVAIYTRNSNTLASASSVFSGVAFASTGAANSHSDSYGGISGTRWRTFAPASWNIVPGEYWLGVIWTASGPAGTTPTVSVYGQTPNPILGMPGGNNDAVGNMGVFSAATGAFPTNIQFSEIVYCHSSSNGNTLSYVQRQPFFRMFGTN